MKYHKLLFLTFWILLAGCAAIPMFSNKKLLNKTTLSIQLCAKPNCLKILLQNISTDSIILHFSKMYGLKQIVNEENFKSSLTSIEGINERSMEGKILLLESGRAFEFEEPFDGSFLSRGTIQVDICTIEEEFTDEITAKTLDCVTSNELKVGVRYYPVRN